MNRNLMVMTTAAALIVGVAACGEGSSSSSTVSAGVDTSSNLGGDRFPVQISGEDYGHRPVLLTGVLTLQDGGCWAIDVGDGPRLVVFPTGFTKPPDDGAVMRGPDGTTVASGMAVDAMGGVVPVAGFPGVPDGYWGNYVGFCGPAIREFAVLDTLEPAFDPQALSADDLAAMVEAADLSRSWGCGIGFAASTADQRVALIIHLKDASGDVKAPVSFPADEWIGEIVIGKHLMTQWCDDAIESWAPEALVVARWPLVGGELDFTPPAELCTAPTPVTATLRNATVETPNGDIVLGRLSLANDAYGCFAG